MSFRTIMIFPEFENVDIIDGIRTKYDPLVDLVRPHITIVFPFELAVSNEELSVILENRLSRVKPFEIEMHGFSKCEDRFGNYLFLNMTKGAESIIRLHDLLYKNEFSQLDMGIPYTPHITVGKLSTVEELNEAYNYVKGINAKFTCKVDKLSVEMIGENEESIIVIERTFA